jgi:citrate lyase subunit beta/citryl-CoA lyase
VWLDFNDPGGMQRSLERSKREGFAGRLCIHPKQVDQVNLAFKPSVEEVANARKIVEAFETAMKDNVAAIRLDGRLVDLPIVRSAQRVIDLARDHSEPNP